VNDRVRAHVELFNASFQSGDWKAFTDTFTDDAVMTFVGVPAGPFHGRAAIAEAYARQPPTDTMSVRTVETSGDTDVVRFAWSAGGTGTMTMRWRAGKVAELVVAFD
jgi:steroid Delta-isomerase